MVIDKTEINTPPHVLEAIRRSNETAIATIIEVGKSVNGLIYGIPPGVIEAICNAKRIERDKLAKLPFPIWESRIKNKEIIEKMLQTGFGNIEAVNALLASMQNTITK